GGAIGDGTWQNPLQVWQVHVGTTVDNHISNWVCGYIVGYVDTDNGNKPMIGTSGAVQSNVLMAQYPYDEEDWENRGYTVSDCISVQLPSGTVSRSALNLSANPGNMNKLVSVRGTTGAKYCGIYGVRAANEYNFGAIGRYEPPVEEIAGEYFCNFTASHDINYYRERGWATYMIKGGIDAWDVKEGGGECYAHVSVYYGSATGGPYENWIVSPAFDLDQANEKTLSFSTQATGQGESSLEVYVMSHQNPKGCDPVKVECVVAEAPASGYSSWVSSGTVDLSGFSGKVYIGFRYYSVHGGGSDAIEYGITNVNLGGADPEEWEIIDPASIADYRRVDSVVSGRNYLLVFNDNLMMIPFSGNFGNFEVREVTFNEDGTITAKRENGFIFEAIPDSEDYMLIDGNGKYVYMKGTYTNFNVSTELLDAYKWTVTPDENGVFEIRNTTRNLIMIYDSSKNNIGTTSPTWYQGRGAALYEEIVNDSAAN
ncbi:MAG: choice-of-anchor J domain-containing protein, partial [Muribaculaceae bacterium]|nr:choice-of-anchor J domain-containing protein [Muribaculaceae bacterium]